MIIESKNFILSGINVPSKLIIEQHGKAWKVVEEKAKIPSLKMRAGYILKSFQDGKVIILKKHCSEFFKIENEYFTEQKIVLEEQS